MESIRHVYGNVMKVAIPLTEKIRTLVDGQETEVTQDFYPNPKYPVTITLKGVGSIRYTFTADVDGNVVLFTDNGNTRVGQYDVEVLAYDDNEEQVRYKVNSAIEIVDATADAGIEAGVEFNVETYTLEGAVFFYAKGEKGDKGDDGVGIASVEQIQTSHVSEGVNIIRVTLTNGVTSDFEIRNGAKPSVVVENETLKFL